MEQWDITEHKTCHSSFHPRIIYAVLPRLYTFPEAIHSIPTKDKQSPEPLLSRLIKGKKTSQRESSGIRWLRDGTGEGQLVWDWVWTGGQGPHYPEGPQ